MMGVIAPSAPGPGMPAPLARRRPLMPPHDLVRPSKERTKSKDRARRAHAKRGRTRSRADAHGGRRTEAPRPDPSCPPAVWGHTQYTMLDVHAHAAPGMKRSADAPAAACSEPAPTLNEPLHRATSSDLLAPFAPVAPPAPPLQAVYMEGYGRLALHPHVLGAAAPAAPAPVPSEAPQERSERLRLVAHWLQTDDDLDDGDSHGAGARAAAVTYHPMVAKGLREQSRRCTRRSPRAPRRDWWIASDGTRQPRGAPGSTARRRMVSTMHALAASGIAPSMACRCGFTDDHMDMVQCDGCARWVHLACAGVSHVDQLPDADWVCDDCYDQQTAMAQPRAARAANHTGLHAHALQRSSTLSLAPSPKRSLEGRPFLPEHDVSSVDGSRALWRTPSPPPSLQLVGTPSRHFTPFAHAEWLPTPTHFLAHTPYSGLRTPSRPLGPLDSPTAATRRAQYLATPSQASPLHSDPVSSSVALSSPMPVTPTGPARSRLLAMPLGSPATPKTAPVAQMPLAWAWD
ncbi:hypothetical protein MCAP1_002709 [Malassezia caprae]|uniref:PHD-type domain-containing protein n=1 Tax=Malassezia caprae TaxID=1381934 RepID=A0AAF0E9U8_9BASI|nr:hypothetical protein MCAP1_002709 [Malassezia caprae]